MRLDLVLEGELAVVRFEQDLGGHGVGGPDDVERLEMLFEEGPLLRRRVADDGAGRVVDRLPKLLRRCRRRACFVEGSLIEPLQVLDARDQLVESLPRGDEPRQRGHEEKRGEEQAAEDGRLERRGLRLRQFDTPKEDDEAQVAGARE